MYSHSNLHQLGRYLAVLQAHFSHRAHLDVMPSHPCPDRHGSALLTVLYSTVREYHLFASGCLALGMPTPKTDRDQHPSKELLLLSAELRADFGAQRAWDLFEIMRYRDGED